MEFASIVKYVFLAQTIKSRPACTCDINKGVGCTLGARPIPEHACRCELDGPLTYPNTKCIGEVVECNNKAAEACKNPTKGFASCMQGVFGQQGNCCGYTEGRCIIPVVVSSIPLTTTTYPPIVVAPIYEDPKYYDDPEYTEGFLENIKDFRNFKQY